MKPQAAPTPQVPQVWRVTVARTFVRDHLDREAQQGFHEVIAESIGRIVLVADWAFLTNLIADAEEHVAYEPTSPIRSAAKRMIARLTPQLANEPEPLR